MSVSGGRAEETTEAFRPRARLLQLLGDQLIGSPKLAVFELVKNAYDADASVVTVRLEGLRGSNPQISVTDNGEGMSLKTIRDIWLVPGDDHREKERLARKRSPKFGRLPLGEKGVGRFAVHKLGDRIRMVTRAARHPECVVDIDWEKLLRRKYLQDAEISLLHREPQQFTKGETGTAIEITRLRETDWTRRDVRDLYRQLTSISSPFGEYDNDFSVYMEVPEHPEWISTLPDTSDILRRAPWHFAFDFDGTGISYTYTFRGVPGISVSQRSVARAGQPLQIVAREDRDELDPSERRTKKGGQKIVAQTSTIDGIGPVSGQFYVFDRDRVVLSKLADSRFIERFLDQNGGVRVYRDGIRVYNYGEAGDDWLGLDLRRVNSPTRNISRNIVLGAVEINLSASTDLREKTNREGFVENNAYERLQQITVGALSVFEAERRIDKQKMRVATGETIQPSRDLSGPVGDLRRIARRHDLGSELEPAIRRIESDYNELRDNFLRAGLSQVGLALVFHEVERGVSVLYRAIESGTSLDVLRTQAGQLQGVLETSTQLLRKGDKAPHSLRHLVKRARDLALVRFRLHQIKLTCPALEEGSPDASPVFAFGLVLGAITNLIDNAIYWLRVARPDDADPEGARRLYISVVPDYVDGPAIVIADNGTGFLDQPEQMVQPFFSRRPDGMGLGLYYANMVMQLNEGQLQFPPRDEVEVPAEFDGATVALVFSRGGRHV